MMSGRPSSWHGPDTNDPFGAVVALRNRLQQAEEMRLAGRLEEAKTACEGILKSRPDYVAALQTLGLVEADAGRYHAALGPLQQASILNPHDHRILTALSGVYLKLGHGTAALRALSEARDLAPDDANISATLGDICRQQQEFEAGAAAFERALAADPDFHAARFGLGNCLAQLGDAEAAANEFETLIAQKRISAEIVYALAQLPPRFVRSDVRQLCDRLDGMARASQVEHHCLMALSRAAALHNAKHYKEAYAQLAVGNRPLAASMKSAWQSHRKLERHFLNAMSNANLQKRTIDDDSPVSLFIIGSSRSGKTTLERLMAGFKGLRRGHESPIVEHAVRRTFQSANLPTHERVFEVPPALDVLFRDMYRRELTARAPGVRVFTNTHPAHVFGALRLAALLPNARFVFVRRRRIDSVLRIFMRRYLSGNAYAYDLETIIDHLEWFDGMIDALAGKIGDRAQCVTYEEIVADPAETRRRVARLCGIEARAGKVPDLGDDRDCGEPYRKVFEEALSRAI